ncbi:MAG: hypothetical protein R3B54_17175 [Bdellovibrionota bacterium]
MRWANSWMFWSMSTYQALLHKREALNSQKKNMIPRFRPPLKWKPIFSILRHGDATLTEWEVRLAEAVATNTPFGSRTDV